MVSIKNQLARAAAVGALGAMTLAGFVAPAAAASASAGVHASLAAVHVAATGPNTNIRGGPLRWSPTKLTGPPATGTCSGTNNTFTITNKTKKAQTIQVKTSTGRRTLGKVAAGHKAAVCGSGSRGAKAKFFIKGSTSVLTVTLS